MNHNIKIILLTSFLLLSTPLLLNAQEKIMVRVDGLSCAFCAYGLEKNLKELQGVEKVEINLKDGIATVIVKEGKSISDEIINNTVKDSGFTPRSIKKEPLKEKETSNLETAKLKIKGIVCTGCVYNVRTALQHVPSVSEVEVDLQNGTALVKFEKGKVDAQKLIDAVEKAGHYKVTQLQQ